MDRIFYQLTVLTTVACVGVISLSTVVPASRNADSTDFSPNLANNVIIIESENN